MYICIYAYMYVCIHIYTYIYKYVCFILTGLVANDANPNDSATAGDTYPHMCAYIYIYILVCMYFFILAG